MLSKEISTVIRTLPKPTAQQKKLSELHSFVFMDDSSITYVYRDTYTITIGCPNAASFHDTCFVDSPSRAASCMESIEELGFSTAQSRGLIPKYNALAHDVMEDLMTRHQIGDDYEELPPGLLDMLSEYSTILLATASKDSEYRYNLSGVSMQLNAGNFMVHWDNPLEDACGGSVDTRFMSTNGHQLTAVSAHMEHDNYADVILPPFLPKLLAKTMKPGKDQSIEFLLSEKSFLCTWVSNLGNVMSLEAPLIQEKFPSTDRLTKPLQTNLSDYNRAFESCLTVLSKRIDRKWLKPERIFVPLITTGHTDVLLCVNADNVNVISTDDQVLNDWEALYADSYWTKEDFLVLQTQYARVIQNLYKKFTLPDVENRLSESQEGQFPTLISQCFHKEHDHVVTLITAPVRVSDRDLCLAGEIKLIKVG